MHFGKRLEKDLVEKWKPHYIQYKLLKKQIKELEEHGAEISPSDDSANGLLASRQINYQEFQFPGPKAHRFAQLSTFKPLLDKEVEKVNDFTTSKVKELQNRLLQLLRASSPWKGEEGKLSEVPQWQQFLDEQVEESDAIAQELVDLDKYIRQNAIAVQKIIKKFDKRLNFDVAPWLNAQLMENEPFLKMNLDALLLALSDVYEKIGSLKAELKALTNPEVQGEQKKGISAQSFERKTTKYWVRPENLMKTKVSILKNLPIYLFDRKSSDTANASVKSKNFLRDFNDLYENASDSSAISSIYMDNDNGDIYHTRLKREEGAQLFRLRWYGDAKSLPSKDYIFLERKTHHESWVEAKSVKERFPIKTKNVQPFLKGEFNPADTMHKWMKPDNKGFKLIKNEKELEKANELALECKESFQKLKLKPMVRTLYSRTAFQASDHNEVRISIDKNLMMVNENVVPSPDNEFPWCRDMVKHRIPPHDILQFPYCILEVKLNCDAPPMWINDLLADTTAIIERAKFSKFMTGMAYLQYNMVKELPYWFDGQVAIDPRNRFLPEEEKEKLVYQDTTKQFEGADADSDQETSKPLNPVVTFAAAEGPSHQAINVNDDSTETTPLLKYENYEKQKPVVVHSSNEEGKFGLFATLRKRFTGGSGGDSSKQPLKPIRSSNRIKIEPKTSFANERTLIQWVSAASLMITLATLIMTSGSEMGFQAGFVFFPLAFVIMFYAIIRYQYRAWSFRHRRNQFHDDLYGPVFLVISIAAAMGVIMYLMFRTNAEIPYVSPSENIGEGCVKLSSAGIPAYFPHSDVAHADGKLYSVGPFALAEFDAATNTWSSTKLGDYQVVSIVEGQDPNHLYLGIDKPAVFGVFDLSSQKLMTYNLQKEKPDRNVSFKAMAKIDNQILVADNFGSLYKIDLTVQNVSILMNFAEMIPSQRLTSGLIDSEEYKHISGLFYEKKQSVLYALFGRSRVLRVFSYPDMTLKQEWDLPGNAFQWSGISIATEQDGSRVAFLSQSIPSAVWKFKLNGKANKLEAGRFEAFPSCANVYQGDLIDLIEKPHNDRFMRTKPKYVNDF